MHTNEVLDEGSERPYRDRRKPRRPGPKKGSKRIGNKALGERNGASVLTAKDVKTLRRMAEKGVLQADIAVRFGIAKATVSRIVTRKLWAHV